MPDLEVRGELRGAAARVADHTFNENDRTAVIRNGRVTATWTAAPDESGASFGALHMWFENYLLAMSVACGSPGYVQWIGQSATLPGGLVHGEQSLVLRANVVRELPRPLDAYQHLASCIGGDPGAASAAEHVRIAMDLLSQGLEIAAGEAYKAVEVLARSHRREAWRHLGVKMDTTGLGKTASDLEMLWASCQLYRHDRSQVGAARAILGAQPGLDVGQCCLVAAEILEGYCIGRSRNAL